MVAVIESDIIQAMNENYCANCNKPIQRRAYPGMVRTFCGSSCYGKWQKGRSFVEQGKKPRGKRYCSIDSCESIHFGRGYCRKHYLELVYNPPKKPKFSKKEPVSCKQCGIQFIAYHISPKFCSIACASAHRKKPFIVKKGYKKILLPTHPRSDGKGYVFEHIIIAEAMIGRPITREEEIHHKDFNRQNNAPENLVVCASHAEHMRYHATPSCLREK